MSSRRNQDIPIRPRYGIVEDESELEAPDQQNVTITARDKNESTDVASSYSEIPFLAQYPGAVPVHALTDVTPTAMNPMPDGGSDSLEEDDDSEVEDETEESNSKNNSTNARRKLKRPDSLQCDSTFPYELEGATTSAEGEMRHFVAANLEEQLRTASPLSKRDQFGFVSQNSTPSTSTTGLLTRHFLQTQLPLIDANVLSDIEIEAQYLATSVDNLTENLYNLLHSISSITADNVEVHKNAVNKLTDSLDANIKCMYTIMAKTEEITKSMKPTEQLGQRIREIKRLIDMLDSAM